MSIEFLQSLHTFELASITVLTGVLITVLILRVRGISPGGILGASFLILAAGDSVYWALALMAISPVISWVYGRYLSQVYRGREPIIMMAGISVVIASIVGLIMQDYQIIRPNSFSFPLGIIVPAIIASAVYKQGLVQTYRHMTLALALTLGIVFIIYSGGQWLGYDFTGLGRMIESRERLELNWSSLFALASIVIGYLMYRRYQVKSAGYIILPLLATIALISPFNMLLLLATACIVYILAALVRRYSLVIGTGRYALVTALSITVVWTITYLLLNYTDDVSPYMGTGLFAALSVSVLVNEHTIYGIKRAFPILVVSLAVMACVEVGGSLLAESDTPYFQSLQYYIVHPPTDPSR